MNLARDERAGRPTPTVLDLKRDFRRLEPILGEGK
jgi:hypothetical protein